MEEAGGINLYGFVNNSPANAFDVLGFDPASDAELAAINENWFQNGQGGMGGGDGSQDARIASFNSQAASMGNESAVDALLNNKDLGQPLEHTPGGGPIDIGKAVKNFLGDVFSGSSISGAHFAVTLGTPYVVPWAANPFASNSAQTQDEPLRESAADHAYWNAVGRALDATNQIAQLNQQYRALSQNTGKPSMIGGVVRGAWTTTVGVASTVGGVALLTPPAETATLGASTVLGIAGVVNGVAQIGLGVTQIISSVTGGPGNLPQSNGDVVSIATGNQTLGAIYDVASGGNPIKAPQNAYDVIGQIDTGMTIYNQATGAR